MTASGLYRWMTANAVSRCSSRLARRSADVGWTVKSDVGGLATATASIAELITHTTAGGNSWDTYAYLCGNDEAAALA